MGEEEYATQGHNQKSEPHVDRRASGIVLYGQRVSERYLFKVSQDDLVSIDQQWILATFFSDLLIGLGQVLLRKLRVEGKRHRSLAVGSCDLELRSRVVVVSRQRGWSRIVDIEIRIEVHVSDRADPRDLSGTIATYGNRRQSRTAAGGRFEGNSDLSSIADGQERILKEPIAAIIADVIQVHAHMLRDI